MSKSETFEVESRPKVPLGPCTLVDRAHQSTDPWREDNYDEVVTLKNGRRVVISYGPLANGRRYVTRVCADPRPA